MTEFTAKTAEEWQDQMARRWGCINDMDAPDAQFVKAIREEIALLAEEEGQYYSHLRATPMTGKDIQLLFSHLATKIRRLP